MKETLDEQSRLGLMHYRMERADEALEEAAILSERCHYNAAVNRLYYACFYAVQAFIAHGKTFNTLFEKRHSSDYEAFAYCDKTLWMTSLRWPSHLYYK